MRRDLLSSIVAVLALTALLGVAYPLAVTGVAQVVFPGRADGSLIVRDDAIVGSRLIGQDFKDAPQYFQSRPSATGHAADATSFSNAGPNSRRLRTEIRARARVYLRRESPDDPGLALSDVPADAAQSSASGIDPQISVRNARIQAARVARVRGLSKRRVLTLTDRYTDGRGLALFGQPGVNVLQLNLALDRETSR